MDSQLNAKQLELVERAESLAMERFAPRAAELDRRAAFPFEDFADLAESGLLGLCVPESCGGLGADNMSSKLLQPPHQYCTVPLY